MSIHRRLLLLLATVAAAGLSACAAPFPAGSCCRPCACEPGGPTGGAPDDPYLDAARRHGRGSGGVWSFLSAAYDRDHDGKVAPAEYPRDPRRFKDLDRDHDGVLTPADFSGPTRMDTYVTALVLARLAADVAPTHGVPATTDAVPAVAKPASPRDDDDLPDDAALARVVAAADGNHDGVIDEPELDASLARAQAVPRKGVLDLPPGVRPFPSFLAAADRDGSGTLSLAELVAWRRHMEEEAEERAIEEQRAQAKAAAEKLAKGPSPTDAPPQDAPSRAAPSKAGEAQAKAPKVAKRPPAPAVGAPAPDFTLATRDGTAKRTLSAFRGTTAVALVFGSYTCPPFRATAAPIRATFDRYGDRVKFLFVYVREAHAVDGPAPMPAEDQPLVEEPRTLAERSAVANACAVNLRFDVFDTVVDGPDDAVARAYVAPPARLYVVSKDGKIAYRSEPGPFGLDPAAFDAAVKAAAAR